MPTPENTAYYHLVTRVTNPGQIPTETWSWFSDAQAYKGAYPFERRPFPTVPLWQVMTSRPEIFTSVNTAMRVKLESTRTSDGRFTEAWGGMFSPVGVTQPRLDTCIQALLLKIKSQRVNLAETSFEYRLTGQMFVDLGNALMAAIRRGVEIRGQLKMRKAAKAPNRFFKYHPPLPSRRKRLTGDAINDAWLIDRFGIVPLVNDLGNAIDRLQRPKPLKRVVRVSTHRINYGSGTMAGPSLAGVPSTAKYRAFWEVREQAFAVCTYDTSKIDQFTMGNILSLGYELTSLSWILDSFIKVGDWLSSLDALEGVNIQATCVTRRQLLQSHVQGVSSSPTVKGSVARVFTERKGHYTCKWYRRDVGRALNPMSGVPQWRPSPTWKRIVDCLAVARVMHRDTRTF